MASSSISGGRPNFACEAHRKCEKTVARWVVSGDVTGNGQNKKYSGTSGGEGVGGGGGGGGRRTNVLLPTTPDFSAIDRLPLSFALNPPHFAFTLFPLFSLHLQPCAFQTSVFCCVVFVDREAYKIQTRVRARA